MMNAPNTNAKMKKIGDMTSNIIAKNKSAVKAGQITPDVISKAVADPVGFDYKGALIKGMKK